MSPPFDTEREANEDLRNEDLGVVQLPEQDQDFPAQIEASEETANEEEAEPDKAELRSVRSSNIFRISAQCGS